ncbi:MAG: c-type cytochrome [Verrucomicrobiae bacterium]|nr:c-type cytochrome [Verrucomicrobiae bacterium]
MRNVPETVHAYKISRLNWIFIFFSLLFVAATFWAFWFDYIGYRKWKNYQKEFQTIEAAKLKHDIGEADLNATKAGLGDLEKQIDDQENKIHANDATRKKLEKEADIFRVKFEKQDTLFKFRKADLDAQKYKYDVAFEELRDHPGDEKARTQFDEEKQKLDANKKVVADLERGAQEKEGLYKAKLAEIDQIVGTRNALEKERKLLLSKRDLMAKRYRMLTDPVIQNVVNAPMIEVAEPTIRVKQIELSDHLFNVNFTEVPRIDRCISCHVGIDKRDPVSKEGGEAAHTTPTADEMKKGTFRYADLPQPFAAHPHPDLFVADGSFHPMDKFGCTPCHWGWDRGMAFTSSAHTPDEEKTAYLDFRYTGMKQPLKVSQKEEWEKKYNWQEMHHAEQKMRPAEFIESSCLKCHTGQTTIPHADKLDRGIRLVEQAGCFNCHKMRQLETFVSHKVKEGEDLYAVARLLSSDVTSIREANGLKTDEVKIGTELQIPVRTLTKTGPSLYGVSSKVTKDWMRNWLAEPKRFRPNTFMPQFWNLESTYVRLTNMSDTIKYRGVSGEEFSMHDRDQVEIDSITETIFALSDAQKLPAPPVAGDLARGKTLVESAGCFACHVVNQRLEKKQTYTDGTPVDDKQFPLLTLEGVKVPSLDEAQYKRSRSQGPMLFGSGSKMDVNWLYAWLKDPKQYHPHTRMPNLRLSDQEAADIAAHLVTLKNDDFEKRSAKEAQARAAKEQDTFKRLRNDITQEYLEGEFPMAEARNMVKNGDLDGKVGEFIGRVKYCDVNELLKRWLGDIDAVNSLSPTASDADRKALKNQIERLNQEMQDLAERRPAVAKLLRNWAPGLPDLATKAATWTSLDETDRKKYFTVSCESWKAAQKAFNEFAHSEAAALNLETKEKLYVGDKLISRYGCYSCHNLRGYDNAKPIGAELSEWGTKLTSTLDYGYLEEKVEHNNYAYVQQKVKAPRSFDKTEVKKPQEWLKMPQFNFTPEQRKEIAIVIMGMTDEKVLPQARKNLSESEWQIENGRWIVKELNCVGCHVVEKNGGAILATLDPSQKQMWPPNLAGIGTKLKPTWLYHFLQDPGDNKYRYWLNVRMPTFGFSDEQINTLSRYFALLDEQLFPFEQGALQTKYSPPKENVESGEQIYEKFQCLKCHQVRPAEMAARASNIGPDMRVVKTRMRPKGIVTWLRDPSAITPGVNMPANWPTEADGQNPLPKVLDGSTEKQIQAVADYLLTYDGSIEARHPLPKEEPADAAGGKSDYE